MFTRDGMASILLVRQATLSPAGDNRKLEDGNLATDKPALLIQSRSDPIPIPVHKLDCVLNDDDEDAIEEAQAVLYEPIASSSHNVHAKIVGSSPSYATCESSSINSRSNSPFSARPSLPSTGTPASICTVDVNNENKVTEASTIPLRRPSILGRLRSSISTISGTNDRYQRLDVQPSDFRRPPEHPERHFIDSIGMVIPGVCDRDQCSHPLSHFVINWRLCDPIEYSTALADHGITHSDYCRLLNALANFVEDIPNEPNPRQRGTGHWWNPRIWRESYPIRPGKNKGRNSIEPLDHHKKSKEQALKLNALLAEISFHWRARGVPAVVCASSFSLFAPNRISESHIQVLHVALNPQTSDPGSRKSMPGQRLSFVDPASLLIKTCEIENLSVSMPHDKRSQSSPSPPSHVSGNIFHHNHSQVRDRTRPWPLWPNAIPTRKRDLINSHADRYGIDPYFRAWMRANVNSRTHSTSYAKYMIEQEDNPFINKRLEFASMPSKRELVRGLITKGYTKWTEDCLSVVNRKNYDHNRRLECRKTMEHGSRLRLARFAFRRPLFPPHTPEMGELGLTEESYKKIITDIEDIRNDTKLSPNYCTSRLATFSRFSIRLLRHRSADDALVKVSEYIRQVNAEQRRLVWTIEKIPGAYFTKLGRNKKEWEISVWNGEDALELLLQLEKWGIIEKRLFIDDDD